LPCLLAAGLREDAAGNEHRDAHAAPLHDTPPAGWPPALQALWHQGKGDWDRAHQLAQGQDDAEGAWVHAHLHRAEGDVANARYWYRRAGREPSTVPLDEEFAAIAAALLARVPEPGERR
jgi:hypothetical protein